MSSLEGYHGKKSGLDERRAQRLRRASAPGGRENDRGRIKHAFHGQKGPYINSAVGEGIRSLTIYEFEDSKFTEASKQIGKLMGAFYGVPGFTYSLQVWFRAKDAFEFTVLPENLWAKK
jgi:hypothetical protein